MDNEEAEMEVPPNPLLKEGGSSSSNQGGGILGGVEEGGAAHLTPLNQVGGRRHPAEEHLHALQQHLTINQRGVKRRYPRPARCCLKSG